MTNDKKDKTVEKNIEQSKKKIKEKDEKKGKLDPYDEIVDQTFPASDPIGSY